MSPKLIALCFSLAFEYLALGAPNLTPLVNHPKVQATNEATAPRDLGKILLSQVPCSPEALDIIFQSLARGIDAITDSGRTTWQIAERYLNTIEFEKGALEEQFQDKFYKRQCPIVFDVYGYDSSSKTPFKKNPSMLISFYDIKTKQCAQEMRYSLSPIISKEGQILEYRIKVDKPKIPFLKKINPFGKKMYEWTDACDTRDLSNFEKSHKSFLRNPPQEVAPYIKSE